MILWKHIIMEKENKKKQVAEGFERFVGELFGLAVSEQFRGLT